VQDGVYDSDVFPGDLSVNVQVMEQSVITMRKGTAIAALWPVLESHDVSVGAAANEQREAADAFYRRKSTGTRYAQSLCPHHTSVTSGDQSP